MKPQVVVYSQEEYDEAVKNKQYDITVRSQRTIDIQWGTVVTVDHKGSIAASNDTFIWARDLAQVVAAGVNVYASDNTYTYASNKATVDVFGFARVEACGGSDVHASNFTIVSATDTCSVWATDKSKIVARDHCTVHAHDEATVDAYDNTTIYRLGPHVTINVHGANVTIID